MLSVTARRNPSRVYANHEFDPYINTMRIDFAYAAAGAFYASQSVANRTFVANIDSVIVKMFQQAGRSPRLPEQEARELVRSPGLSLYRQFSSILVPDLAYQEFKTIDR